MVTKTNIRFYLLAAALLFFICTVGYSTCSEINKNRQKSALAGQPDEAKLAEVITPELSDGMMIHYPGFDVFFSRDNHQPYYVSWVLTPENVRNVTYPRTNNFRPDPDVAESATIQDYKKSGYDRGHMAPSADFRYDLEAQEATFFLTNICPQHNQLNTRAWKNLEDQCRNWAERDSTIIIVCGPVLSDYLTHTIGDTEVTVPDRFFKVVLAPYANPPRAIGFIMPNTKVNGGVQATAVTVDQVEAITGFDFFSALPDELEDEVESSVKYSLWQSSRKN